MKCSLSEGPVLTKTKNIRKNIKKSFLFKNSKKMSERIAQGKPQLKFERNPCIKFTDNCDTDGRMDDGRTTDDRRRTNCDFMSSADIVKQS